MSTTLLFTFADTDSNFTVTQATLEKLAKHLEMTEIETIHLAIRALAKAEFSRGMNDYPPLTDEQLEAIQEEANKYLPPGPRVWKKRLFDDKSTPEDE